MIMEQYFPLFEEGRLLKKESLDSLRDFGAAYIGVQYGHYGNGIVDGFEIKECSQGIVVEGGILKDGEIYFIRKEPTRLVYTTFGELTLVVLRRLERICCGDFERRRYSLELRANGALGEGEYELGRFRLEKGAKLRTAEDYKDFQDAVTEYNTLNVVQVRCSCEGGSGLSPILLKQYAKDIMHSTQAEPLDFGFAMICLNSRHIGVEVVKQYLSSRCGEKIVIDWKDQGCIYRLLGELRRKLLQGNGNPLSKKEKSGKTIID